MPATSSHMDSPTLHHYKQGGAVSCGSATGVGVFDSVVWEHYGQLLFGQVARRRGFCPGESASREES